MENTGGDATPAHKSGMPVRFSRFVLHVFALSGLVLAQPVYSWISAQPQFLIAHGARGPEVAWVVVVLSLIFPLLLVGLVLPGRLFGRRIFSFFQVFLIAILSGLYGLHVLTLPGMWPLLVFALFMLAGALLYWRLGLFRQMLAWAAVLALLLPAWFVLTDPVRTQVFSTGEVIATLAADGAMVAEDERPEQLVILVLLDELSVTMLIDSQGRIDRERFPGFARLADKSTRYPSASAPYSGTSASVSSLVTGQLPDSEEYLKPNWQHHPQNLFTWSASVLGDVIAATEVTTRFCPQMICQLDPMETRFWLTSDLFVLTGHKVVPGQWSQYILPGVDEQWHRLADGTSFPQLVAGVFLSVYSLIQMETVTLGTIFDRENPWRELLDETESMDQGLYYHHSFLPHVPFEYLSGGQRYTDVLRDHSYREINDDRVHNVLEFQRHLAQVRHVDSLLDQLMDALQEHGHWDDVMLVVTSDHGRSFRRDGHWRGMDEANLGELLSIPLFIKFPGQSEGRVDHYPASLKDVLPTIADVLGHQPGWTMDGTALAAEDRPDRAQTHFSCMGRFMCLPEIQDQADENELVSLTHEAFVRQRQEAWEWGQAHARYIPALDFIVPDVPEADLLSFALEDFEVRLSEHGRLQLFDAEEQTGVALDSGWLPALVGGYVDGVMLREDESLVLVLNGELAGVGIVAERDDRQVLGALLPAAAFVEDDNELRVFRVEWENDEAVSLKELSVVPAS